MATVEVSTWPETIGGTRVRFWLPKIVLEAFEEACGISDDIFFLVFFMIIMTPHPAAGRVLLQAWSPVRFLPALFCVILALRFLMGGARAGHRDHIRVIGRRPYVLLLSCLLLTVNCELSVC